VEGYQEIPIETDNIKLQQFLKWANIVESGGIAKLLIQEGKIKVNGEVEYKRGRRLVNGDTVEINGYSKFKVITTP
jgi:ribosome-associated protein